MTRKIFITVCLVINVATWGPIGYFYFFGPCRNAPTIVTFHQGMTICPGQTAILDPNRDGWVITPNIDRPGILKVRP